MTRWPPRLTPTYTLVPYTTPSRSETGDFSHDTLIVYNGGQTPATSVEIRNLLPPGLRFRPGTLRVGDRYPGSPSQGTLDRIPSGGIGPAAMAAGMRRAAIPQAGPVEPLMREGGREMLFNVGDLGLGEAIRDRKSTRLNSSH